MCAMAHASNEYLENPFTPTFGEAPAYLAGRQSILRNLRNAYKRQTRDPHLTTLISGARGTGKTSLLSVAASQAEEYGWVCVNVSAVPGMLQDIIERTKEAASHLLSSEASTKISGIGIGQFNVDFERTQPSMGNWRTQMNAIFQELEKTNTGLLITVDEVQPNLDEMVILAAVYQHFVREKKRVALLMAGLPHNVSQLLQDKSVSFLRRAKQVSIGRIADNEIAGALCKTVASGGRTIEDDAVANAKQAIDGFPFMLQLVGYHAWEACVGDCITKQDVATGTELAASEMKQEILAASWRSLSGKDREFLVALLATNGRSTIEEIAKHMGVSRSYAAQYKYRLLEQGLIAEPEKSVIEFALPVLAEYVAEQAV